jgi:hypothetical protein
MSEGLLFIMPKDQMELYQPLDIVIWEVSQTKTRDHCGRDRVVVGFKTTYAISAYHH